MDTVIDLENNFFKIPGLVGNGHESDVYPTFKDFIQDTHDNRLKDNKMSNFKFENIDN